MKKSQMKIAEVVLFILFSYIVIANIVCASGKKGFSSQAVNSYVYVYLRPNVPLRIDDNLRTNDDELNRILRKHRVERFFQSWPNAKTKSLLNIYEMHFGDSKGNSELLRADLMALDFFVMFEIAEYYIVE